MLEFKNFTRQECIELNGSADEFWAQKEENIACAKVIADAINDSCYEPFRYDLEEALKVAAERFPVERIENILARSVFHEKDYFTEYEQTGKHWDGRFSKSVLKWAAEVINAQENGYNEHLYGEARYALARKTHPTLIDAIAEKFMKIKDELEHTAEEIERD